MPTISTRLNLPLRIALFSYGFRPFFLLAGLYGTLSLATWALIYPGVVQPSILAASSIWHGHEMLFGFSMAAAAGFLLTAVPAWTGTKPISGWPLAALVAIWIAGRLAFHLTELIPPVVVAIVDLGFVPALAVAIGRPLLAAGRARNLVFVILLTLLFAANAMVHAEAMGLTADSARFGLRLAIYIVVFMAVLILGRIAPRFTANALAARGVEIQAAPRPWIERLMVAALIGTAIADLSGAPTTIMGLLAAIAAASLIWRMRFWRSGETLGQPILWVLHLGHAWIAIGFACLAISALTELLAPDSALHALTVGAMGTSILAVMTRASLGHTGRPLIAPRPVVAAYLLVTLAATTRVFGPALSPEAAIFSTTASGAFWVLAFGIFTAVFAPVLMLPRADGKQG